MEQHFANRHERRKFNKGGTPFSGKRIRQDGGKARAIRKRDRRLQKIGLSVMAFTQKFPWFQYFATRKDNAKD